MGSQSFTLGVFAVVRNILSMNLNYLVRDHFNELLVQHVFLSYIQGIRFGDFIVENWGSLFLGSIYGDLFEGDFFWRLGPFSVEELFSRDFCWEWFSRNFCGELFSVKCFFLANYFRGIFLLGIDFMGKVFLRILFCGIFFGNYLGNF